MPTASVPSACKDPSIGYNGQLHEPAVRWQVLGNGYRVFNAVLMRFHSPDNESPFARGGIHAYAYCDGDPVNFADPTGRSLQHVFMGLALGAGVFGGAAAAFGGAGADRERDIFTAVAIGLGIAAAVVLGGVALGRLSGKAASSSRPATLREGQSVNIGKATFHSRSDKDILVSHGNFFKTLTTRPVSGGTLAGQVKKAVGPGYNFKPVEIQSCFFPDGILGQGSQAQAFVNKFGQPAYTYRGTVTRASPGTFASKRGAERVVHPEASRLQRQRTAAVNTVMSHVGRVIGFGDVRPGVVHQLRRS